MLDGGCADLLHDGAELDAQKLEHALDARLAKRAETPDIGPTDADALRAHRQRLGDVGAAAEAAVDQDRHPAAHRFDDFRQRVDGGTPAVFAARAVAGDDDWVHAGVYGELRVLMRENARDHD